MHSGVSSQQSPKKEEVSEDVSLKRQSAKLAAVGGVIAAVAWSLRQSQHEQWKTLMMMAAVTVLSAVGLKMGSEEKKGDDRALRPGLYGDGRAEAWSTEAELHHGSQEDGRADDGVWQLHRRSDGDGRAWHQEARRVCALKGPGGDQLPIRPGRTNQESQAVLRGKAASSSFGVRGGYTDAPPGLEIDERLGSSSQASKEKSQGKKKEDKEMVRTIRPEEMKSSPVRLEPSQCMAVTRLCLPREEGEVVSIWDLEMFHRPPRGDDKWLLLWDHLLVRSHGRPRTRAFHPLHRSTPVALENLLGNRCSILFPVSGEERLVKLDAWSQNLPFFQGQWKGYTVFDVSRPSSGSIPKRTSEESDGSYEVVEEE